MPVLKLRGPFTVSNGKYRVEAYEKDVLQEMHHLGCLLKQRYSIQVMGHDLPHQLSSKGGHYQQARIALLHMVLGAVKPQAASIC